MKTFFHFIFCFLFASASVHGQGAPDSTVDAMDGVFETALENGTRDLEDSEFAESLFRLSVERVDVNEATANELLQIPGIDPLLASRILAFRSRRPFQTVNELLMVQGIDRRLLKEIRGFFKIIAARPTGKNSGTWTIQYTGRASSDLQTRQGYRDGTYVGSPFKFYNRIKGRCPLGADFFAEAAGLTEKDAGEKSIADFTTGYLMFGATSGSFQCVVGNYVVESGQGLVFWRSSGSTKGSEVIASVSRNSRGLQPNASSDENGFLRGIAVRNKFGRLEITVLYSQKKINAGINEAGQIASFDASGLFRTSSEQAKRGSSSEQILGLNVDGRIMEGFRVGLRGYRSRFGNPVESPGLQTAPFSTISVAGVDFSYASSHFGSFGEAAVDRNKSLALLGGIVLEPARAVAAAVAVRAYPRSFISLHGFGFGEAGSQLRNERGFYVSARISVFEWMAVSGYYDQFVFPGPGSVSPLPTSGHESTLSAVMRFRGESTVAIQVRQKAQSAKLQTADEYLRLMTMTGTSNQANYRATFEWWPAPTLRWKTRFEYVRVNDGIGIGGSQGYLFFQDLRFVHSGKFSLDGRAIVFDTDSYVSRIYEFESDVRGTFANPALYGKGLRLYFLARYDMGRTGLSVKYASTVRPGLRTLSSGPAEIAGDTDNRISVQVDVTL